MGNGQALRGIVCQELEYRVKNAVVPSINRLHLLDQKQTLERQGIMGFVDRDPRVPVHKTGCRQMEYMYDAQHLHRVYCFMVQDGIRAECRNILRNVSIGMGARLPAERGRTHIGVMMLSTFLLLSSNTPLRILISSSRRGSSPVR